LLKGDFQQMARRRFQDPTPFKEGNWFWLNVWTDELREGRLQRKRKRLKVCPADTPEREAKKIAAEMLRPMNQGLQTIGSATKFAEYVNGTYRSTALPLLASTTRTSYEGTLRKYLMPVFGDMPLRDLSTLNLQKYFSGMAATQIGGDTVLKIKEVLSSVLGSAVRYDLLTRNPVLAVQIPRSKVVNKNKPKPHLSPEEFSRLVEFVEEPYSTMIVVAVMSGLRISELAALRWEGVHKDSLTVVERFCRGDWSVTKTKASASTISVSPAVISRIQRLKTLEVEINWGGKGAKKRIKVVRDDSPQQLVFQSLRKGSPMSDGNILRRHLRPAAIKLGIEPKKATWRSLRTSCATWMVEAGANPKDVQGQMRHTRISTTMDIYAQHVPESQKRAVERMMDMVQSRAQQQSTAVN
jgi:integrase